MKKILLLLVLLVCCFSCNKSESKSEEIEIQPISCDSMKEKILKDAILIDVRSENEYNNNTLSGAINIPVEEIKDKIKNFVKDKNASIIVFCQSGGRSNKAANILKDLGYKNIYDLGAISNCN